MIIKDLDINNFYKIKDKEYINKIYIQENEKLKEIEKTNTDFNTKNNNIYKIWQYKKICDYSSDIIKTLDLSYNDAINKCDFNKKLLTVYALIDIDILK